MGALHADKDGKSAFIWPFWSPTTSAMVIMYSAHQQQWQEAQRFAKTVATQKPNGLYLISILKAFICFYETLRVVSALSVYSHLCYWAHGVPVCIVCSRQMCICVCFSLSTQFLNYLVWDMPPSPLWSGKQPPIFALKPSHQFLWNFQPLGYKFANLLFLTQQCKGYAIFGNWIGL